MKGVNLMERESMLIYKSFIDVSESLNDKDYRLFWNAIHKFGVYGQEIPEFDNPTLNALMVLILPLLKANIRNYENGKKGGAPKGNKNAKSKTTEKQPGVDSGLNEETTQKQGNVNVTDNVTANVTVTDNEKKEICPFVDKDGYITDFEKFQDWKAKHPNWKGDDD